MLVSFGMERNGNARTESQNCLKPPWTLFYTYILVYRYRYKQVIATNWRLKSRKLARRRWAWQAQLIARHRKRSRAWNQLLFPKTEHIFTISLTSMLQFSRGLVQDGQKMQTWILVSNLSEVSPNAKYFAIYFLVLWNTTVCKWCQIGSWETPLL